MLRSLDETGALVGAGLVMPDDELVRLYRAMLTARTFDEQALHMERTGRLPAYYQSSGMEAAAGAVFALRPDDWIFGGYRDQPVRLARGVRVVEELALWKGVFDRVWDPRERRLTPLNVTIGTHLPHAVGFAYARRLEGDDQISLAVFGDGATSEGDFHAGLNFAGVWNAPVVFLCLNNLYAQSTPVEKQTASATLAQKAEAYGFPGVQVDGMDALAVYEAANEAVAKAAAGGGPTLIEAVMYRYGAHSTYDGVPAYRSREEEAEWRDKDPLDRMRLLVSGRGLVEEGFEDGVREEVTAEVATAIDELESATPISRPDLARNMYASVPRHLDEQLEDGVIRIELEPSGLNPAKDDPPVEGETMRMTMVEALNAAIDAGMAANPRMVLLGEDVGFEGGVFRVTAGLQERYGEERVIDAPLSEIGIVGTAVGMAIGGVKPVCELEFAGFMNPAFDQLIFHVARYRWRTRGTIATPVVARMASGGGHQGLEGHSDSPEDYFLHTPGLLVVYPSNPIDAKGLMATALMADDPVVFFEPIAQYFVAQEGVPVANYEIPFGRARIERAGDDVTVVAYGNAVHAAAEAAVSLEVDGVSPEVIDLRTIKPWDEEAVMASVAKTGRLVVCHEAPTIGGVGAEIVATVADTGGYLLETPPTRVGHPDSSWAPSLLERHSLLEPDRIARAVRRVLED